MPALLVLLPQPLERALLEVILDQRRGEHFIACQLEQLAPDPVFHRQAESLLATHRDTLGQALAHCALEQPLRRKAVELGARGQRVAELDHAMIQEGRANFEAVCHRHLVDLHQHAVRQDRVQLEVLFPQASLRGCGVRPAFEGAERIQIEALQEIGLENGDGHARIQEILPAQMLSGARQDGALKEALENVSQPFLHIVVAEPCDQSAI